MSEATITSKGQVTIPAEIRKALGLSAGERKVAMADMNIGRG